MSALTAALSGYPKMSPSFNIMARTSTSLCQISKSYKLLKNFNKLIPDWSTRHRFQAVERTNDKALARQAACQFS